MPWRSIYGSHSVQTKKKQKKAELQVLIVYQRMFVFLSYIFYIPEKTCFTVSEHPHSHKPDTCFPTINKE